MQELHKTWDDIASNWHRWASPLRPCQEDLDIMYESLQDWGEFYKDVSPAAVYDIFVLGVTPEIVTMPFPFRNHLVGMDIADNMVKEVWPGDIPFARHAIVGDWFDKDTTNHADSVDVVLADGSFVFFGKDKREELAKKVNQMLGRYGIFVARHFVCPVREKIKDIIIDVQSGRLRNFHELKFRVAMSLQTNSDEGVTQDAIYNIVKDIPKLELNPAFSKSDLKTLEFYKGKEARLYFPTAEEYIELFSKYFHKVHLTYPKYQFGGCCPTITAKDPILGL